MEKVTLTIDGRQVTAPAGATVLDAARGAGIEIPTLCAHEALPNFGACRLCIVEIEQVRGFPTSCTTPAANGMIVRTRTPELIELRNNTLELMLSGHPNSCLVCDHREDCEKHKPRPTKAGQSTRCGSCSNQSGCTIRGMSLEAKSDNLHLPTLYSQYKVERDDPFIERDHNLCVLCGKCWRICEKIHGKPAISIVNRGRGAKIGTAFDASWIDAGCTFCGACVDICPTGTITDRYARWHGAGHDGASSICTICPEGCALTTVISDGKVVATRMPEFARTQRLCAVGRFAYPQLINSRQRLRRPMLREEGELVPVPWEEAIEGVAKALRTCPGGGFLAIVSASEMGETRAAYARFARDVMHGDVATIPANGTIDDLRPRQAREKLVAGKYDGVLVTGAYLPEEIISNIPYLVVCDCLPSAASERASALLPVAILAEVGGSFRDALYELKQSAKAVEPPGQARAEREILAALAAAIAPSTSFSAEFNDDGDAPLALPLRPRDLLNDLPARYRGHLLADVVPALQAMGLPFTPRAEVVKSAEGFAIVEQREIVPNFFKLVIHAPAVARYAKPGQFAIVMAEETSERSPFTLVDWDAGAGTITLVIEDVGRSSHEIAGLQAGDVLAHVSGPLGLPLPIEHVGTVVLGGGCYGVGSIYPIARAMKAAGNRVISVIEGCSAHMLYMEEELRGVSDELLIATKDGSRGAKGGVQEWFEKLYARETKPDLFVAIGCAFMMKMVAEKTRGLGVPLQVAMNPVMVDGTGMCGACRVAVGKETKFACVDGPFFDGHQVDWDQLFARRNAYVHAEVEAMPQAAGSHGGKSCSHTRHVEMKVLANTQF